MSVGIFDVLTPPSLSWHSYRLGERRFHRVSIGASHRDGGHGGRVRLGLCGNPFEWEQVCVGGKGKGGSDGRGGGCTGIGEGR